MQHYCANLSIVDLGNAALLCKPIVDLGDAAVDLGDAAVDLGDAAVDMRDAAVDMRDAL